MTDAKLKVLFISSRADYGGGPEHLYQLIRNCKSIDAYVACPEDKPYWSRFSEYLGGNLIRIPHRRFRFTSLFRLIMFLREKDIDVIHTHGKGAGLYGRLASMLTKRPCVHTPHGIHLGQYGSIQKVLYRLYENLSGRFVRKLIFVSASEQEEAVKHGLWPASDSMIIGNAVKSVSAEKKLIWREGMRKLLGINSESCVIAMISRFDFAKNMDEAYQIARGLPDFQFLWIGDGSDRLELQSRSNQLGVRNIRFLGFQDEPLPYLAASDIYVSTSRWEGLPISMLEAMSLGLPIVATDVVGHHDLVKPGKNGFLYPLGDIEESIVLLNNLQDEGMRVVMGAKSRQMQRDNFSLELISKNMDEFYQSLAREVYAGATK